MKARSVKYLTREGLKNVWVNRMMSIASVGVLMACMVLIGIAILIGQNVNRAMAKIEEQNDAINDIKIGFARFLVLAPAK